MASVKLSATAAATKTAITMPSTIDRRDDTAGTLSAVVSGQRETADLGVFCDTPAEAEGHFRSTRRSRLRRWRTTGSNASYALDAALGEARDPGSSAVLFRVGRPRFDSLLRVEPDDLAVELRLPPHRCERFRVALRASKEPARFLSARQEPLPS